MSQLNIALLATENWLLYPPHTERIISKEKKNQIFNILVLSGRAGINQQIHRSASCHYWTSTQPYRLAFRQCRKNNLAFLLFASENPVTFQSPGKLLGSQFTEVKLCNYWTAQAYHLEFRPCHKIKPSYTRYKKRNIFSFFVQYTSNLVLQLLLMLTGTTSALTSRRLPLSTSSALVIAERKLL